VRVVFVGRDRIVWRQLLLYLVTFGIYRRVWLHRVNKELDGHEALGLKHGFNAFLLCLPFLGPAIVAYQTSWRTSRMLAGSGIRFGHPILVWLPNLVPILGAFFFLPWTQTRLNRFWALERASPEHGVEIDVALDDDPAFLIELGRALRESYHPGSRFDQDKAARHEAFERRRQAYQAIRQERAAVRAAGGSTPLLPWQRPRLPETRILHVTCGRCEARFDVVQDPLVDTPVVCPNCKLSEVLPSLKGDPLRGAEKAAVPVLQARCPQCKTAFTGVRNLHGPTVLTCPTCGREDTLPTPETRGAAGSEAAPTATLPDRPRRRSA
jgi:predicted nucleic acid-binding Zn ribbon protein